MPHHELLCLGEWHLAQFFAPEFSEHCIDPPILINPGLLLWVLGLSRDIFKLGEPRKDYLFLRFDRVVEYRIGLARVGRMRMTTGYGTQGRFDMS